MALLGTLQIRLGLDAGIFNTQLQRLAGDVQKRVSVFQKSLSGLTNFGALVGGAGLTAAITQGLKEAGNFESSINQVGAAADATAPQLQQLADLALDLAKKSTFSATEIAQGMLDLAKAGITPEQMGTGTLAASLQLAATEGMALSRAAEVMAEQMGAFGLKADDAASIADALAGASIASTASVEGLAQALSQSAATASLSGASLNDTVASLALLAQNGIKGSDAGTSLKTMFLRLVPSTKEAAGELAKYNISFTRADGSIKSLTEVADILHRTFSGLGEAQRQAALQTIFGTDAFRAAAILTKSGAEGLAQYITATHDKNAAEKLGEARTMGLNGALQRLRNTVQSTFIDKTKEGGSLNWITEAVDSVTEGLKRLSGTSPVLFNFTLGIAAAGAAAPYLAAGINAIAGAIPVLIRGLALATGPLGLALAATGIAAYAFKDEIMGALQPLREWFSSWVAANSGTFAALSQAWNSLLATLRPLFDAFLGAVRTIGLAILSAFGVEPAGFLENFKVVAGGALTSIVNGATFLLGKLTEFSVWLAGNLPGWGAKVGGFASAAVTHLREFGSFIRQEMSPVIAALGPYLTSIFNLGKSAIQSFGIVAKTVFGESSGNFSSFKEIASAAFSGLMQGVTWLLQHLTKFTNWLASNLPGATQAAVDFANRARTAIGDFAAKAREWFAGILNSGIALWFDLQAALETAGNYVSTTFGPLWESLKTLFGEIYRIASELGSIAMVAIRKAFEECKPAFEAISGAAKTVIGAFTSVGEEAQSVFGKLGEKILSIIKSFDWPKIGHFIVKGIADGIKGNIDLATSAIRGLGDTAISTLKNVLGIRSPSRVFYGLAEDVVAGWVNGLADGRQAAQAATLGLLGVPDRHYPNAPRAIPVDEATLRPLETGAQRFQQAWEIATDNTHRAIDDLVRNGELSFRGLVDSIIADFASAQLNKAVSALFKGLSGMASGTTSTGSGGWASLVGSIVGALGSFDGGGYTGSGLRSGGLDGKGGRLAILHPRETVIDHTRVAAARPPASSAPALNLSVPIHLQPGVSREELARLMPVVKKDIITTVADLVTRGGRYASAFGQ